MPVCAFFPYVYLFENSGSVLEVKKSKFSLLSNDGGGQTFREFFKSSFFQSGTGISETFFKTNRHKVSPSAISSKMQNLL